MLRSTALQLLCFFLSAQLHFNGANASGPSESRLVSEYGPWKVYQIIGSSSSECRMTKRVSKEIFLVVSADANEGFALGMVDTSWSLGSSDIVNGYLRFDEVYRYDATASIENPKLVFLHSGGEESSPEMPFRRSTSVHVQVNQSWLRTDLRGSSKATDLLYSCVESHSATSNKTEVQSGSCYKLNTNVTLSGYPFDMVVPGPPEFSNIMQGDRSLTAQFLYLQKPICISGQPAGLNTIQLACQGIRFSEGVPLTVSGSLFEAHTGYHWSPVLLECRK